MLWREALRRPDGPVEAWLASLARRLLNGVRLVAGGEPHRLVEVEAYYHSADHPDPFAHRNPIQVHPARWYFHKTGGGYRSGSFKGLDLTFGDGVAHGGLLFRGLETPDGALVDGPSLLVDYLLRQCGMSSVVALDRAIDGREAGDLASPLHLVDIAEPERAVLASCRVGLSLRRVPATPPNIDYLLRRYRFLTEPGRTAKGKAHMVLALILQGQTDEAIRRATQCPTGTIRRYREEFERARTSDPGSFGGVELGALELCRMHGHATK